MEKYEKLREKYIKDGEIYMNMLFSPSKSKEKEPRKIGGALKKVLAVFSRK